MTVLACSSRALRSARNLTLALACGFGALLSVGCSDDEPSDTGPDASSSSGGSSSGAPANCPAISEDGTCPEGCRSGTGSGYDVERNCLKTEEVVITCQPPEVQPLAHACHLLSDGRIYSASQTFASIPGFDECPDSVPNLGGTNAPPFCAD